jgi:hypothetical protein
VRGAALVLGILAALSGVVWLAATVVNNVTDLKQDLAAAKRDIVALRDRVARVERRLEELNSTRPSDPQAKGNSGSAPLQLSAQAVQLLRDYIKVPPAPAGTKPAFSVGASIPEATLLPIPQQIADKAPELNGMRFTTDKDGSILIVGKGSRRVDAIVPVN